MSKLRFRVVESAFEKKATELTTPAERPSEYYGELVFNREKMFKYLPERAYERLVDSIDNGTPLDRETANAVASGMKKWAMEKELGKMKKEGLLDYHKNEFEIKLEF